MSRLTKAEARAHDQAQALLDAGSPLDIEDRLFVAEHWQESAHHVNNLVGAFFTPYGLAKDLMFEIGETRRVIDLCAGIGALALAVWIRSQNPLDRRPVEITCVEANPAYVAAGRQLLPEATWIQSSVFHLPSGLGEFDVAISNPPFGRLRRDGNSPTYPGPEFEFHVLSVASQLAPRGVFILPQGSLPWRYSGRPQFEEVPNSKAAKFTTATGIELESGIGIDTSAFDEDWHKVQPRTEVVRCDFQPATTTPPSTEPSDLALFDLAAAR